jgi:hypothetical protein
MGHRSPRQPGPTAGQNAGDAIALAIAAVRTNGFEPDAIVVNPTDYVAMQIAKASTAGTCLLGEPAASPSPTVWGVTLVPTQTSRQAPPSSGSSEARRCSSASRW